MKLFIIALSVVSLSLVSCSEKIAEKLTEKTMEKIVEAQIGENSQVDITKQGLSIKTDQGDVKMAIGEGAKLPDGFPKDIYVVPQAKIEMAMNMPTGTMVNLTTSVSAADVVSSYKSKMVADGWKQATSMAIGGQTMLSYTKEKRNVSITVAHEDNKTTVTIIAGMM